MTSSVKCNLAAAQKKEERKGNKSPYLELHDANSAEIGEGGVHDAAVLAEELVEFIRGDDLWRSKGGGQKWSNLDHPFVFLIFFSAFSKLSANILPLNFS